MRSIESGPGTVRPRRRAFALAGIALLAGCASLPPPQTSPAPAGTAPALDPRGPADRRAGLAAAVSRERQWLQSWFVGTPVAIGQVGETAIAIEVPLEFCFDRGSSRIKPPLAAVLEKVGESLRRVRDVDLVLVAAPDDERGRPRLAVQRAEQVRRQLRLHGIATARLARGSASASDALQLRIGLADD